MRRLRVSRAARRDLIEIAEFTLDKWGEAQCERYLAQLDTRMRSLVRRPTQGRPCDEIRQGYWRCVEGRHVIFFTFTAQTLDVIRVLHVQMLPERHL